MYICIYVTPTFRKPATAIPKAAPKPALILNRGTVRAYDRDGLCADEPPPPRQDPFAADVFACTEYHWNHLGWSPPAQPTSFVDQTAWARQDRAAAGIFDLPRPPERRATSSTNLGLDGIFKRQADHQGDSATKHLRTGPVAPELEPPAEQFPSEPLADSFLHHELFDSFA